VCGDGPSACGVPGSFRAVSFFSNDMRNLSTRTPAEAAGGVAEQDRNARATLAPASRTGEKALCGKHLARRGRGTAGLAKVASRAGFRTAAA
jgi:hypothetical protein